ncbi:glycoside hydrolase family 43 protein [Macrolepiota fuliginosa MF-IS2]|uniref:Glycoside hydrolase family 43 protein n=1 Tax=Macrolepiota fuliginosa MF-IS2 TaxID=1400762 RepID=A0A9P5XD49_9AGAR|nr:glycoside hydrolase family 43 protein [Macrolepiota fuliginosa MF-IS2]
MRILLLLFVQALVLNVFAQAKNPILPGWNPDPTILRVGEDYFIATSTFECFPGHPIYHSKNLKDWTLIGHGLNRPLQLGLYGTPSDAGVWAPSLRYHKGTFYMTSTKRYVYTSELRLFPRSFYVKTNDIFSNNWSDPVYFDSLGYDADLFWDTNGDVYLTWSGINNNHDKIYSIYQAKIDLATGTSLTPAQIIFNGTLPHTSTARPEGPHIYHINSTYYLLIAEGGTGITHRATIQRSQAGPSGPWENNPNNPILFNGANMKLSVQNTGHADLVQAVSGEWWGVALGVRPQGEDANRLNREQLGRETFLFPVNWVDGWPVFNNGQPLSEEVLSHNDTTTSDSTAVEETKQANTYFNNFTSNTLDNTFYNLRTPYAPFYSITSSHTLQLRPNPYAPGDRDSPAILLRKQTSYTETFETELHFPTPKTQLEEAGVSIFYGDMLHNEIGVSGPPEGEGDGRFIVVRTVTLNQQVGPWALTTENATVTHTTYIPLSTLDEPIKLRIEATPIEYALAYTEGPAEQWVEVARFDGSVLSTPPTGGFFFKGTSFAVYNTGNGKPSLTKAEFAYWKQGQF